MKHVHKALLLFIFLLFVTAPIYGQTITEETFEDIVVVATKTPTSIEKVGGSTVHVITAEDIELKKITNLRDLLKEVPGIDISSNGGTFGSTTSIFIRGSDANGTLVLIDGVMANDPSSANRSANIGTLALENIERIEIIKGSQSVLYGSNATAGVINIITKKGKKESQVFGNLEAGSYGTTKLAAGASGSVGDLSYSVSASQLSTEGFSIANADNPLIPQGSSTDELDGASNLTVSASIDYEISADFDVSLVVRKISSTYDIDDFGGNYASDSTTQNVQDQQFVGLAVNNRFFDGELNSSFRINMGSDFYTAYSAPNTKNYDFDGNTTELSWQGTIFIGNIQEVTFGLGAMTEDILSNDYAWGSGDIDKKSVTTTSIWSQDKLLLFEENLIIPIGVRMDMHEKFGTALTYRIAPSYEIGETGLVIKAALGTGFQAPSLYNMYNPYGPNENLQPETSQTLDYGFEYRFDNFNTRLGLTIFDNQFENKIDWLGSGYVNLAGLTKTSGLEFTASANMDDVTSLTFASVFTNTKDPNGVALIRRPESKHTLTAQTVFFDNLNTGMTVSQVGRRKASSNAKDKDGNSIAYLDPYLLINASASYDLFENIELYGRIDNLLDTFYEEAWSYATPGRSIYVGVKGTF